MKKKCSRCGRNKHSYEFGLIELDFDHFHRKPSYGFNSVCRDCEKEIEEESRRREQVKRNRRNQKGA